MTSLYLGPKSKFLLLNGACWGVGVLMAILIFGCGMGQKVFNISVGVCVCICQYIHVDRLTDKTSCHLQVWKNSSTWKPRIPTPTALKLKEIGSSVQLIYHKKQGIHLLPTHKKKKRKKINVVCGCKNWKFRWLIENRIRKKNSDSSWNSLCSL